MTRASAVRCRGEISFHHLDGQSVFNSPMLARWAGSREPIERVSDQNANVQLRPGQFTFVYRPEWQIDIFPGENEMLDVAVRFKDEEDCYGWSNDSYLHNWRIPSRKLAKGRYLVRVKVTSAGQSWEELLRPINDVSIQDFRLIEATPLDHQNIKAAFETRK